MKRITRATWWLQKRFPRLVHVLRSMRHVKRNERRRFGGKDPQEVFTEIYEKNLWGSPESLSGAGSTLQATEHLRRELPALVVALGARSFLDAPCGDFHWMQHVPLGVERYIGADIVPQLIEQNQKKYGGRTEGPAGTERTFIHLDIAKGPLPDADIFFCRDCLIHLTNQAVLAVLDNFRRSGCRYLVTTTFEDVRYNPDNYTGGARAPNLCLPPFSLPRPMRLIEDPGESTFERRLGVWSREQLVNKETAS